MGWLNKRRERRTSIPDLGAMRPLVAEAVWQWDLLDDGERDQLVALTVDHTTRIRWEAGRGIDLDDEVRTVIAAHVALMGLKLPHDVLHGVRGVLVTLDDVKLTGEYEFVDGVANDDDMWVSGLADDNGPILISWNALAEDIEYAGSARNVVFHEFAHHLDLLDGVADGTPPLPPEGHARWVEVCTAAYGLAAEGRGGDTLDEYAGVNPTEFFAVATEAFFDAPEVLRDEHPPLYEVLAGYYGIDWAARLDAMPPGPEGPGAGGTIQR